MVQIGRALDGPLWRSGEYTNVFAGMACGSDFFCTVLGYILFFMLLHLFGVHGLVLPISGPFWGVQQVLQLTYQLVPYGSQMWLAGQKLTSYSSMRFPFECQVGIQ